MNWNPKNLSFIPVLRGKAQYCNKDPCCVSDIDTELSSIVSTYVSHFAMSSPTVFPCVCVCVISTGAGGFAQMEGSGEVASSVLNNFPPTRTGTLSPSLPCSCFTIELHSRDKGCDADINDGWQRARFYVWWPIKGCQKNSRKISKKYPFFCDLAPYSHKFLPMNNTPPPSRPPYSFWRNSRLWLTRRNAEPKRTETNHIFCCSSWSDVSTKESVNLFCV